MADKPDCFGWAMERCEEKLWIARYNQVQHRVPATELWKREFDINFFDHGFGVTFDTLAHINAARRRVHLTAVEFVETDIGVYGRSGGRPEDRMHKSETGRQMQKDYLALDTLGRQRWKAEAESEIEVLPPPHRTFDEWEQEKRSAQSLKLSLREQAAPARAIATAAAMRVPTPTPVAAPASRAAAEITRAIRQLKLVAGRPETTTKVIAQLSPDMALAVAESGEIEDQELIDALVLRSLELQAA